MLILTAGARLLIGHSCFFNHRTQAEIQKKCFGFLKEFKGFVFTWRLKIAWFCDPDVAMVPEIVLLCWTSFKVLPSAVMMLSKAAFSSKTCWVDHRLFCLFRVVFFNHRYLKHICDAFFIVDHFTCCLKITNQVPWFLFLYHSTCIGMDSKKMFGPSWKFFLTWHKSLTLFHV